MFVVFLALAIAARVAPYPKCFPDWKASILDGIENSTYY